MTRQIACSLALAVSAGALFALMGAEERAQVILRTDRAFAFEAGKGKSFSVPLCPEWGVLTLRTRMRTKSVVRGAESWMNGRIPMSFHDATGRRVGAWPNVFGFEGTCDWTDCVRDFPIPEGSTRLQIALHNLGVAGTAEYGPLTLEVKRNRAMKPCNAPRPAGVTGDPWSLDDAWMVATGTRTRWSLNGLWGFRPALTNDVAGAVPGANDNWGWGKVPGQLGSVYATGQTPILSDWFEDHGIVPDLGDDVWYRRDFTMPAEAAGKRVLLAFTGLNTRAVVHVDGKAAATVVFPGGEADITAFAKPGARQSLALHVTCHPLDPTTLDFNAPDRAAKRKNVVKNRGIVGDVYLDVLPKKVLIADATAICRVADSHITFIAECEGLGDGVYGLVAKVGDRVFRGENLRARDGALSFDCAFPEPKLWDVHTPGNLYTCTLEVRDAGGALLDEGLPFRFGFRDVRCVGRDLLLNGTPIHLRALYNRNMNGPSGASCRETCLRMCRRLQSEGFNYVIAGNYNFSPGEVGYMDSLLDACDETGLLFSFSLPHIRDFGMKLDDPATAARYRALARWCVRRARNHPSVVSYAMNHNATGYVGDMNPLRIDGVYAPTNTPERTFRNRDQARLAAAIAKSLDGTRPVYHHESGNLDDFHTVNIYLNWAPVQERSDWLQHWSETGVKPLFFVEWGMPHISSWSSYRGPLFIWRKAGYQSLWASEFAAALLGDAAYAGDDPCTVRALDHEERLWAKGAPFMWGVLNQPLRAMTNQYYGVQARYMADNWRSHRAWGITAMLPWDQEAFHERTVPSAPRENPARWADLKRPGVVPDVFGDMGWDAGGGADADWTRRTVGETLLRWNRPDCGFIGGADVFTDKRHHFRPGEKVEKRLVVLNDHRVPQTVKWTCALGAAKLSGETTVPAGGRRDVPVSFALPAQAGTFEIAAEFRFASGDVQRDVFPLESYEPAPTAQVANLWLFDPIGLTAREFDRLGIRYQPVNCTNGLPADARIVVGRGALTRDLLDRVFVPAARNRGRVLVFEQDRATLDALGFRSQEYGLRTAFPRFPERRLGLTEAMLRDWNGEATLTTPYHENLPAVEASYHVGAWSGFLNTRVWRCRNRGNVASVIPEKPSIGDWKAFADGGFDLQYAPLLDWSIERGRITFCQFDVTARTASDPVADDLVNRLVARLADAPVWPKRPRALGQKAWIRGRDAGLSIRQDPEEGESGVYIVSTGAKMPDDFRERIAKGGHALCLGLTREEVAAWSPVPLAMAATNGCHAARIERRPPELDGLSNADWQWHGALDFDAFVEPAPDGNAALRVVRHGKGSIVFWQVPPWRIDAEAKPYLRTSRRRAEAMLARIAANLGCISTAGAVRYADVPVPEDDPYRYYRW